MDNILDQMASIYDKVSKKRGEPTLQEIQAQRKAEEEYLKRDEAIAKQRTEPSFFKRAIGDISEIDTSDPLSAVQSAAKVGYKRTKEAIDEANLGASARKEAEEAEKSIRDTAAGLIKKQRKEARDLVKSAKPEMVDKTRSILKNITDYSNRFAAVDELGKLSKEEQAEVMRLAPGVMQELGNDRGNFAMRALNAVWKGTNDTFVNPAFEIAGQVTGYGMTPEQVSQARYLEGLRQEDAAPVRADDPWYVSGPLGAAEMLPFAAVVSRAGGRLGASGKAFAEGGKLTAAATARLSKAGELSGITAASFPTMYVGEYHALKDMGMEDGVGLRATAALSGVVGSLIEGIVPDPFPSGNVSLKRGAVTAARQYLSEAIKKFPGELSEEGLQGISSGFFQTMASWADENIPDKDASEMFTQGLDQMVDSALPLAFMMGVPSAGKAGMAAAAAQQNQWKMDKMAMDMSPAEARHHAIRLEMLKSLKGKKFVSEGEAAEIGIIGDTRKERMSNLDEQVSALTRMMDIYTRAKQDAGEDPFQQAEVDTQADATADELDANDQGLQDLVDANPENLGDPNSKGESDEVRQQEQQDGQGPQQTGEVGEQVVEEGELQPQEEVDSQDEETRAAKLEQAAQLLEDAGEKEQAAVLRSRAEEIRANAPVAQAEEMEVPEPTDGAQVPEDVEDVVIDEGRADDIFEQQRREREKRKAAVEQRETAPEGIDEQAPPTPKVGEQVSLMGKKFKRSELIDDSENVRSELFESEDGGGAVRMTDLDSGNTIQIKTFPSIAQARSEFEAIDGVRDSRKSAGPVDASSPPLVKTFDEIEAIPKHTVYQRDWNGQRRFMVRGDGKRGGGDSIFDTRAEAEQEAKLAVTREKEDADRQAKAAEKKKADEKAEEEYVASFQGFDAESPMKFGKARKALEKQVNYKGKAQTRKQIIEAAVASGAVVESVLERFPLSRNRRKALQQERLEGRRKYGFTPREVEINKILDQGYEEKAVKRLKFKDDSFLDEAAISATGMRYAEHLTRKKPKAAEQKAETQKSETKESETSESDRDKAVARLKKEHGFDVTPREAANASEREQAEFLASRGKKFAFVDSSDARFGGTVDPSTGFILISGNRDASDIWHTIGHELAHETGLDKIIPADSTELAEWRKNRLDNATASYRKVLEADSGLLDREARAEMVGSFLRDKGFRDKLARENSTMWEKLVDAILKLVGKWTPKDQSQAMVLEELRSAVQKTLDQKGKAFEKPAKKLPEEPAMVRLEKSGVSIKKTKKGWVVQGVPKFIGDGLARENGGKRTSNGYFFKNDPTETFEGFADEIIEEIRESAAAEASGNVRTRIGTLPPKTAEQYEAERASRVEMRMSEPRRVHEVVTTIIDEFIPKHRRGGIRQVLKAAARSSGTDSSSVEGFDKIVQFVRDNPGLNLGVSSRGDVDESALLDILSQGREDLQQLQRDIEEDVDLELLEELNEMMLEWFVQNDQSWAEQMEIASEFQDITNGLFGQGPAAELAEDDIDAMADEILKGELEAEAESRKPKTPKRPASSEKKPGSKKDKPASDKPKEKRSQRTKRKAKDTRQAARKALKDAMKDVRDRLTSGVDPVALGKIVKAALLYVRSDIQTFRGYVEAIVEDFGEAWAKGYAPYIEAAWRALVRAGEVTDPAGKVSEYKVDYGTIESPNRITIGRYFESRFLDGASYKRITEARAEVADLLGGRIEPGTAAAKAVDEAIEQGVVRAARAIALENPEIQTPESKLEKFDKLVDLYKRQPRLAVRTGTSMINQAYSTPAPLAYAAAILSDTSPDMIVYDSSAGNGMLLIGTDEDNAIANEIDKERAKALRSLGFEVTREDGTSFRPDIEPDRIIINPPFGDHLKTRWKIAGQIGEFATDMIDHAISMNTLESLPEDGKAVLIIGSKGFEQGKPKSELERAGSYRNYASFYNVLYDNYNVTDHFTVAGEMYARQGASFPVDVIVIDGRGKSSLPKPNQINFENAVPRVINSWEELRDGAVRHLDTGTGRPVGLGTEIRDDNLPGLQDALEGEDTPAGRRPGRPRDGDGAGPGLVPRTTAADNEPGGLRGDGGVPLDSVERTQPDGSRLPDEGASSEDRGGAKDTSPVDGAGGSLSPSDAETEFQVLYKKKSSLPGGGTLIPRTQAEALRRALDAVEDRYGNIDEFVARELGYDLDEMVKNKYFFAEQIDALALNIARHKEGKAFVLGDQTGVGKGRVAAGMIVYAMRQGLVPVFITYKPGLYADMYRDLTGIGQHSAANRFKALATNELTADKVVTLPDGTIFSQSADYVQAALEQLPESWSLGQGLSATVNVKYTVDKDGNDLGKTATGRQRFRKVEERVEFDAIFTTYDQMRTINGKLMPRHIALQNLAPSAFFILDESHNAGGQEDEGQARENDQDSLSAATIIREFLEVAQGASFLSATYAKRVQVMGLYAKTGMADAVNGDSTKLMETLAKGGIPLQQVLSEMMVEAGAYMRRERTYEGIDFSVSITKPNEESGRDKAREAADEAAALFNAINQFDAIKNDIVKSDAFQAWLIANGLSGGTDVATGRVGVESTTFSSLLHNLVDQMLLGVKAEAVADEAIASLKRGEAPVIALSNTLSAALDYYLLANPAEFGDEIDFGFDSMAGRYLERSRQVLVYTREPGGRRVGRQIRLPDSVLGRSGMLAYNEAKALVDSFASDIPASPIDYIRGRIEAAGYKVAEITGRKKMVKYTADAGQLSQGEMILAPRPESEIGSRGQGKTIRGFNAGGIDAILLNVAGSTGISIHAAREFKNIRRRHMIIAQPDRNIDTFMQTLGRINRTGQVEQLPGMPKGSNLPRYTLLMSNIPAEIRPASVLIKKLSSLNANVTADAKGSVSFDVPDIMNRVGDSVVAEFLADNYEINRVLDPTGRDVLVATRRDGTPRVTPGIAKKATGQLARLPVDQQQEFWDEVARAFNEEIASLDALGKNPLKAAQIDLSAELLERTTIFEGDPDADSPFLQPAYADRFRVKKQGKPYTAAEIQEMLTEIHGRMPSHYEVVKWVEKQSPQIEEDANAAMRAAEDRFRQTPGITEAEVDMRMTPVNLAIRQRVRMVEAALRLLAPGRIVRVSEHGSDDPGVLGVVIASRPAKGKSHLPSGWSLTIALSSPDRSTRIPLSRVGARDGAVAGDVVVEPVGVTFGPGVNEDWDDSSDAYEERIVGTGNILAAYSKLSTDDSQSLGSIVFFTDKTGLSQRGLLMPRTFSMERWQANRPAIFKTPEQVLEFLRMSSEHQVNSPDFAIQAVYSGGELVLRTPVSRARAGRYTTSQAIIDAAGTEFVSIGLAMQMKVKGAEAQEKTLQEILKIGALSTGMNREVALGIIDAKPDTREVDNVKRRVEGAGDVLWQTTASDDQFYRQAADIALDAMDAGIDTYDAFMAMAVEAVGEKTAWKLGPYLQSAARSAKMDGVRSFKEVLKRPTVTIQQAKSLATSTFASVLTPEQMDLGEQIMEALQIGDLPGGSVGLAARGTPTPSAALSQTRMDIWATPDQEISSADTSINQGKLPASFKRIDWKPGTVNADIGGGRFDNATEMLAGLGVENVIYDPFNRSQQHNRAAVRKIAGGKADTATVNNVLNVIKEPSARMQVIQQAADAVGADGTAYFLIYEGDGSGNSKATSKGWQENRKAETYVREIESVFGKVTRKGNMIVASKATYSSDAAPSVLNQQGQRWYSIARDLVQQKMGPRATSDQVLAMLRKNGVKEEEIFWSGLEELLGGEKASVTKEQVLAAIDNGIRIEETMLPLPEDVSLLGDGYDAGDDTTPAGALRWLRERGIWIEDNMAGDPEWYNSALVDEQMDRDDILNLPIDVQQRIAIVEQLDAQQQVEAADQAYRVPWRDARKRREPKFGSFTLPGGGYYKEIAMYSPSIEPYDGESPQHFGVETSQRAIAWIRFNERIDADGNKVMFLEEVQESDRHKEGRKRGYAKPRWTASEEARLRELEKPRPDSELTQAEREEYQALISKQETPGVPDSPFKKTWHMLAMKRAIQHAVENGFDRIAWTTGEQQAERYDLSKQIDELVYVKNGDGSYSIQVFKDGDIQDIPKLNQVKESELEGALGKDIAQKIINGEGTQGPVSDYRNEMRRNRYAQHLFDADYELLSEESMARVDEMMEADDETGLGQSLKGKSLRGLDLKMGGEGMRTFYDAVLVNDTNKLIKKFGGKVGTTRLRKLIVGGRRTPQGGTLQPSFEITPAMRESALAKGQPLFQGQAENIKGWTKFVSATQALIGATDKGDFSTFIHEMFHPIRRFLLSRKVPLERRQGITDEMLDALEEYAGVEGGVWDTRAEEKAARAWEIYWLEGHAPTEMLRKLFEKVAQWMRGIYKGFKATEGSQLPPKIRLLFDLIVQRGAPTGFEPGPEFDQPGAPPPDSPSHPENFVRVEPDRHELTALAKQVMNDLRELASIEEIPATRPETVKQWLEQAEITMALDPNAGIRLYRDIVNSPGRAIDHHETALLALHYRRLANEADNAAVEMMEAAQSGDPERITKARSEFIRTRAPMTEFEELTYASKSTWGRTGVMLQVMLRRDFSFAGLMRRSRQANLGKELTEDQEEKIREIADKNKKLQEELDKVRAEKDRERAEIESKKQHDDVVSKTPRKQKPADRPSNAVNSIWEKFSKVTGLDLLFQGEESPYELVVMGYRELGVKSFGELMRHVSQRLGDAKANELRRTFLDAWRSTAPAPSSPSAVNPGDAAELTRKARRIQRDLVEAGFRDRDEIIELVREEMSMETWMEFTTIDAMDALSRYGQYSLPSKDKIDSLVRQMNAETLKLRQIIQLERAVNRAESIRRSNPEMTDEQIGDMLIKEGMMVKPTGPQREKPDAVLRDLQRKYNALKADVPVSTEGREGMLQSALGAIERSLQNRIEDLRRAIDNEEEIIRKKSDPKTNQRIEEQRAELAELTKEYRKKFPPKGLSEEQRIRNAIKAAERSISLMQKKIDSRDFDKPTRKKLSSPELDAIRAEQKAVRAHMEALKSLEISQWESEGGTVSPDPREAAARKARLASIYRRIAEYKRIVAEKDFDRKTRPVVVLSKEEIDAAKKLHDAKREALEAIARFHLDNLKGIKWTVDKVKEFAHLSRALKTSLDASALLNQGALVALGRPKLAARVLRDVAMSLARNFDKSNVLNRKNLSMKDLEMFLTGIDSSRAEFEMMEQLTSGDWGEFRVRAGLHLTTTEQEITKQEEMFQGRWGKFFPGVAISGRVYTMMINQLRADLFDIMTSSLSIGGNPTLAEAKLIAHYINVATGRSDLKGVPVLDFLEKQSEFLNAIFFAARFTISRFQYLAMAGYLPFAGGGISKNWNAKMAIYKEMGWTLAGFATLNAIIAMIGILFYDEDDPDRPTVEVWDSTSSDYWKVKIGDTRIDFGGGIFQTIVFANRMIQGRIGDNEFGDTSNPTKTNRLNLTLNFLRQKLAPVPGFVVTGLNDWKDPVGNRQDRLFGINALKVHPAIGTFSDLFVPLSGQNVLDSVQDHGFGKGGILATLSFFGTRVSTYGEKTEYVNADDTEREGLLKKYLNRMKWDSKDPGFAEFLSPEEWRKVEDRRMALRQKVVNTALANPVRDNFREEEDYLKAMERKKKAIEDVRRAGIGQEEMRELLLGYWRRNYGSPYQTTRGRIRVKDAVIDRLREINNVAGGVPAEEE